MLALLQIINHMIVGLEYSEAEVKAAFEAIVDGETTVQDLLDVLGLELGPTMLTLAEKKAYRWQSALTVIQMRES